MTNHAILKTHFSAVSQHLPPPSPSHTVRDFSRAPISVGGTLIEPAVQAAIWNITWLASPQPVCLRHLPKPSLLLVVECCPEPAPRFHLP